MVKSVKIKNSLIGPGNPCFIIAEAGVNHNGDMILAHKLIDAAVKTGVDAIKFQSFKTEELVTPEAQKARYQVETTGDSGGQFAMLKSLELTVNQQKELKTHCDNAELLYLCTPYEEGSVDLLAEIGVSGYKIASTDVTNIPFLRYIAKKDLPVILSTGMSTLSEVEESVNELKLSGLNGKIIILQCTSEYPAPVKDINLRAMKTIGLALGCPAGFSDHTTGGGASPWAVAAGDCVVEKHFTLDRRQDHDHHASIEPSELKELINTIRNVEVALGDGITRPMSSEIANKPRMQKSLVATRTINISTRTH
jgi:N,N'-diacetyllegionaminate synthase